MAPRRTLPLGPLIGALVIGAAGAGLIGWRVNLQAIETQIIEKRNALKKLVLSGKIPPNEEVLAYLTSRQAALEQRYARWLETVTAAPVAEAAGADAQLYFQERFHDVQRTLERLAAARSMAVPEQLGFPKELPPSDMVPRLLAQLSLIQDLAEVLFEHGVAELVSFKIEDPQSVAARGGDAAFLLGAPVRVRFSASVPQLMKVLAAVERERPLIDVRALRTTPHATLPDVLEVEAVCVRYLAIAAGPETVTPAASQPTRPTSGPRAGRRKASRASGPSQQDDE